MEKSSQTPRNRTGISISPELSESMISGAKKFTKNRNGAGEKIATIDMEYIYESDSVGSMPVPPAPEAAAKAGVKKGPGLQVFLNKLGERLAFERSGIRIYESVITRCEAGDESHPVGPVTVDELRHMRDEEAQHFQLITDTIVLLGADPTAQTPDADVTGVAAMGIQHVLNDPRSSMAQCLEMLLTLELTDNAAWDLLILLSEDLGLDKTTEEFRQALSQEEEHLRRVRKWANEITMSAAHSQ